METNPFQAPSATPPPMVPNDLSGGPETIRNRYLKHEAQIKSLGVLYYLGSIFMIFAAFATFTQPIPKTEALGTAALLVLFGFLQIFIGSGLRSLKSWARVVAIILSALGLLMITINPIGAIISLFMLLILSSKKSTAIFTPEYRAIMAATPHIKYKSSIVFKICLVFLAVIVLIGIIAAVFTASVGK